MKETLHPLDTVSHQAVGRAVEVTAAVEVSLEVMEAAAATNHHLSMEEVTTTSRRATTPLLHRATVNRARMVRVEDTETTALR